MTRISMMEENYCRFIQNYLKALKQYGVKDAEVVSTRKMNRKLRQKASDRFRSLELKQMLAKVTGLTCLFDSLLETQADWPKELVCDFVTDAPDFESVQFELNGIVGTLVKHRGHLYFPYYGCFHFNDDWSKLKHYEIGLGNKEQPIGAEREILVSTPETIDQYKFRFSK